jgi:hypothetical protein
MISIAPLRPQRVQRADRRRRSLDALAPQRITSGANGIGAECPQPMPVQLSDDIRNCPLCVIENCPPPLCHGLG